MIKREDKFGVKLVGLNLIIAGIAISLLLLIVVIQPTKRLLLLVHMLSYITNKVCLFQYYTKINKPKNK